MIDYLKRLRRPGLIAVLVVISVLVITTIGHFVVLLTRGNGLAGAARLAGASSPSLLWVFAAIVLAFACVLARPRVADSQRLVSAAVRRRRRRGGPGLCFAVRHLTVTVLGALGGLIEIAAKGACGWVLADARINAEERSARISTPSTGEPRVSRRSEPQQATGCCIARGMASGARLLLPRRAVPSRPPSSHPHCPGRPPARQPRGIRPAPARMPRSQARAARPLTGRPPTGHRGPISSRFRPLRPT